MGTDIPSLLMSALDYTKEGFKVFPLQVKGKKPITEHGLKDATQMQSGVRTLWKSNPAANIGLVCDGLIVLDFDADHDGYRGKDLLAQDHGPLPATRVHKTGGGGEHWLYRAPRDLNVRPGSGKYGYPGLDIRANDSYIVAPPSVHPSGTVYQVMDPAPIAPAPAWLLELATKRRAAEIPAGPSSPEGAPIPEGSRNGTLASLAGTMRRRGMSPAAIEAAILEVNRTQCRPPLDEAEVRGIAASVSRYDPGRTASLGAAPPSGNGDGEELAGPFHLTDLGNAERLMKTYGRDIRYCYERKSWLIWKGTHWRWDKGGDIMHLAQRVARSIYQEAGAEDDKDQRKKIAEWAHTSESNTRVNAMAAMAEPMGAIPFEKLDAGQWNLNCLNGTIDLTTGELRPHRREDYITVVCQYPYQPAAHSEEWEAFMGKITAGDQDIQAYLQRCIGYTLTGSTSEQCFFFCSGEGGNGKSTFLNSFKEILAPYTAQANAEMFMSQLHPGGAGHSEDVANLAGKRFVVATELEENRRMAVSKIKQMTGGEAMRASFKYEHEFEYKVTYKIWLNANHKPTISDTTYSIWRRIKVVPFTVKISAAEDIKEYHLVLLERGGPAILAWAVRGCLDWQKRGLVEPRGITDATSTYRHEEDILADFYAACCYLSKDAECVVSHKEIFGRYQDWCHENSTDPVTSRTFAKKLQERGRIQKYLGLGQLKWRYIRLLKVDEEPQGVDEVDKVDEYSGTFLSRENIAEVSAITPSSSTLTPERVDETEDFHFEEGL